MAYIVSKSEKETHLLGRQFAKRLKGRAVIGLVGELGAGKTQFVKGLAKALNIKASITSPTFVLMKNYRLVAAHHPLGNLIHIDCYRLSSPQELLDLGWDELIQGKNNLVIVEWADKIKKIMPRQSQWIKFKTGKNKNERTIAFDLVF